MAELDYKFDVGIAAISWVNDDIPGLGDETTIDEILAEMNELGYVATEKGRTFPDNLQKLKTVLNKHNMILASQFVSVMFSKPELKEKELKKFKAQAKFLKEMGCDYIIVCEMGGSMHWDPEGKENQQVQRLDEEGWDSLADGLNRAGEISNELGLTLVYHFHAGTVVEQKEEIDQLMEMTSPTKVSLLFDTGHALYGNYDPEELLTKYLDRIKYVHYKDVRLDVLKACRAKGHTFREEVLAGVFTVPGDGVIDFKPLMKKLMDNGYKGWVIVEAEQDPAKANPYEYAKKAKEYLDETEKLLLEKIKL